MSLFGNFYRRGELESLNDVRGGANISEGVSEAEKKRIELTTALRNSEEDVRKKLAEDAYYLCADEIAKQAKDKYGRLDFSSNLDRDSVGTVDVNLHRAKYLSECMFAGSGKFVGYASGMHTESGLRIRLTDLLNELWNSVRVSDSLRKAIVENGLVSDDEVDLLFDNGDRVRNFVMEIRNEISGAEALKEELIVETRNLVEREVAKKFPLSETLTYHLRKYGRKFNVVVENKFSVTDFEGKQVCIDNDTVVVTSRGVFVVTSILMPEFSTLIVTSDGNTELKDAYYSEGTLVVREVEHLIEELSQNVGYTVEMLREKVGKFVPVIPVVLLTGGNYFAVENGSSFKFIRENMLYETMYGFDGDGPLTNSDVAKIVDVLESGKEKVVDGEKMYSVLDYKTLTDMWAAEYKTLTKLSEVVTYFNTELDKFYKDHGLD